MRYILIIFLLSGCATTESFHHVVTIPETKIHMVSSTKDIPGENIGYAKKGEIWVLCYKYYDKIKCYDKIMGHE